MGRLGKREHLRSKAEPPPHEDTWDRVVSNYHRRCCVGSRQQVMGATVHKCMIGAFFRFVKQLNREI
jgi:hypothetical protein